MEVKIRKMTIALRNTNTKLTKLSKKANAGDVEHIMKLQDVGPKMLVVIRVIKKVTYPHAVRMSKISEKQPKPERVKVQEEAKAKKKVKVLTKQIRQTIVMPVNSVGSIIKVVNRARNRTQPSQRLRSKWH